MLHLLSAEPRANFGIFVKCVLKQVKYLKYIISKLYFLVIVYRSSHQRCSIKKGVLENFAKFTGKQLCQILFLIKCNFIKKEALARVFFCEFYKTFVNTIFTDQLWWLLLKIPTRRVTLDKVNEIITAMHYQYIKNVCIWSFFWSVFSYIPNEYADLNL